MLFHKRHPPVGARPGTLVFPVDGVPPVVRLIEYDADRLVEREVHDVEELRDCCDGDGVSWIDVQGLGDEALIRRLGELFALHPLALEDVVNVPQRPKAEDYDRQHLFITRMARLLPGRAPEPALEIEQVSIFVGARYVLTLQERPGDVFDPVRARLRAGKGPIRHAGADYLAYALIDTIIDGYYPVLEALGDRLEALEHDIFARPDRATLRAVHEVKRQLLTLRRAVWPQREAVAALIRGESALIGERARLFLRDSHDHVMQILDVSESYRELAGSLVDTYMSLASNRSNEVMKVLTIMASIFIPLTFLAGIYGMNFEHMPELHARWSYPILLGIMVLVAAAMLFYFRRRGWLGGVGEEV